MVAVLMRRVCLLGVALLAFSCGGGNQMPTVGPSPVTPPTPTPAPPPTPPTPRPNVISGAWTGTMRFRWNGETPAPGMYALAIRVDIQQQDRLIAGTWVATSPGNEGTRGDIRGTLAGVDRDTTFTGTVTWEGEPSTMTGRCRGVASFSGSASPGLEWQSTGWDYGETCRNSLSQVTWSLTLPPVF